MRPHPSPPQGTQPSHSQPHRAGTHAHFPNRFASLPACLAIVAAFHGFISQLGSTLQAQTSRPNLALRRPVTASGPTWSGLPESNLTDGSTSTLSHPLAASGTRGYYFQIDLGASRKLESVVLRNRTDGCCPERLSRYRVEIYADAGGETGTRVWSADIRTDGTHSGVSGADTVRATADPGGTFRGRFVRIVNASGAGYNPQMSEVEVYGPEAPVIEAFTVDNDALAPGESTVLRWRLRNATQASLSHGIGTVAPTEGSAVIHPTETQVYRLTASNDAGSESAELTVGVGVRLDPPILAEFVADNADGPKDIDGDRPDWLELANPNRFTLNLEGYHLTDDPGRPTKWRLPALRLPGGARIIVFASGKDRRDPTQPLHTNFRLDADGDRLALVDRDGRTFLQQYPHEGPATTRFPPLGKDIAYGLGTNGLVGFLRPPSPAEPNGAAYTGIVEPVLVSPGRGFFDAPVTVSLSCPTPGVVVRVTTDRTDPGPGRGREYVEPLRLTNNTVLKVAAFRDGWASTPVATHTFVFPNTVIQSPSMRPSITRDPIFGPQMRDALMDLPSVAIASARAVNDTAEVPGSVEWLNPDGSPGANENCGIRFFGGAFTAFAKESFRLYFRGDYGATRFRYPIFRGHPRGLMADDEFDQLELRNGSHDMEMRGFYMSNVFTDDTMLDLGHLNPRGRFVHLYLNGAYWGVYHLRERWGASMHARYLGGSKTNYESINGNWNVGGWADPGVPYDGDGSTWSRIKSLRSNYATLRDWLDVPQYIDYMLMWMFGGAEDEYRCVGPTVPGTGFQFYLNDADGWFCVPQYCAAGNRTARSTPGRQGGDGPGSLFSMLLAAGDPDYRVLLADRIQAALFNDGPLTPSRNLQRLTNRCDELQRPFLAEAARWNYLTPAAWASRRDSVMKSWLPGRTTDVLSQFRGAGLLPPVAAPQFTTSSREATNGQILQWAAPTGATVYYTLDGSDPRLPGGAISQRARSWRPGGFSQFLVAPGSNWRWYTDASGLGSSSTVDGSAEWSTRSWKHPDFDDSRWGIGPSQFGYGEGDEATVIPFGPDANAKWITSYFRHRFNLANPASFTSTTLRLRRDDGAILYLNGHELLRTSMPEGNVTPTTPAIAASDDGQTWIEFTVPTAALRKGPNLLAVEIHQAAPNSSDTTFDLDWSGQRDAVSSDPLPTLDRNTFVRSRSHNGTTWSGITEAFFQVGPDAVQPGELVFSEIHFHPAGHADAEFIEVLNVSTRAVDLRSARFTHGIQFVFPPDRATVLAPGQRLVLAADRFVFASRYGSRLPIAGKYAGRLDNSGESLVLADPLGRTLATAAYAAAPPWPDAAAGQGYSLVLARRDVDPSRPEAWRPSRILHGTPGQPEESQFHGNPADDADLDGWPALLEHACGTSDASPGDRPNWVAAGVRSVAVDRDLLVSDTLLVVESSTDLTNWTEARIAPSIPLPGGERAREVWTAADLDGPVLFYRLKAVPVHP